MVSIHRSIADCAHLWRFVTDKFDIWQVHFNFTDIAVSELSELSGVIDTSQNMAVSLIPLSKNSAALLTIAKSKLSGVIDTAESAKSESP